jgi:hypothetical protein
MVGWTSTDRVGLVEVRGGGAGQSGEMAGLESRTLIVRQSGLPPPKL